MLTLAAGGLLYLFSPPARPTEEARAAHGHRVFALGRGGVRALSVELGGVSVEVARVGASGWTIDGKPAHGVAADAVEELVDTLVKLRALDVFRAVDGATFGLDPPRGRVEIDAARGGRRRLLLGQHTADGAAFFAQRTGDPRVLKLGAGLDSSLERLLHARRLVDVAAPSV